MSVAKGGKRESRPRVAVTANARLEDKEI